MDGEPGNQPLILYRNTLLYLGSGRYQRLLNIPSPLQPLPQLPLLLQNLQLQPLDPVLQRLPPLPHHPRPQPLILRQPPPPSPALLFPAGRRRRLAQPAGLELRARAQRLDAPLLAGEVGVCAVEEEGYEGGYFGAEGGFGGGEGWLGDQFVVLVSLVTCSLIQGPWSLVCSGCGSGSQGDIGVVFV